MTVVSALRHRVYELLEPDAGNSRQAHWTHRALLLLVLVNVACSIVDTIPSVNARYDRLFDRFEAFSLFVFGAEYLARVWCAPENPIYGDRSESRARLSWARSLAGIVDLIAVAPFIVSLAIDVDLRVLVLLRLLRVFKIARYSPGFRSLSEAVRMDRHALAACVVILISVILISAGMMYAVENDAQPDKFGSIPEAMWWAAATVTTVGYGDVVPITIAGRVIGVFTMIAGLLMFALPAGIIATSFAGIISRNHFVVTAAMVARMPLFEGLDASAIIEFLPLISTRTFGPDNYVLYRGQPAGALYLITEGRVMIEQGRRGHILGPGRGFGAVPQAQFGVRVLNRVKLLVIEEHDIKSLSRVHPQVAQRLEIFQNEIQRPKAAPQQPAAGAQIAAPASTPTLVQPAESSQPGSAVESGAPR